MQLRMRMAHARMVGLCLRSSHPNRYPSRLPGCTSLLPLSNVLDLQFYSYLFLWLPFKLFASLSFSQQAASYVRLWLPRPRRCTPCLLCPR